MKLFKRISLLLLTLLLAFISFNDANKNVNTVKASETNKQYTYIASIGWYGDNIEYAVVGDTLTIETDEYAANIYVDNSLQKSIELGSTDTYTFDSNVAYDEIAIGSTTVSFYFVSFRYVEYSLNQGTGTTPTDTEKYFVGDTINLPSDDLFSREGYAFRGWNTDSTKTQGMTSYILNSTNVVYTNDVITFYAIWEEIITYNVSYVLNEGTNSINNPATFYSTQSCDLEDPTRVGHIFCGWYEDNTFEGTPIYVLEEGIKEDVTLYAKWIECVTYDNVTYDKCFEAERYANAPHYAGFYYLSSGNYILDKDIILKTAIRVEEDQKVNICLNGKLLIKDQTSNVTFANYGTLNFVDNCSTESYIKYNSDDSNYDVISSNTTGYTKITGGAIVGFYSAVNDIFDDYSKMSFNNIDFYNCKIGEVKNFIYNSLSATTTINNCNFSSCGNNGANGTAFIYSVKEVNINNCTFDNNKCGSGMLINVHSGELNIDNCKFTNNESTNSGCCIFNNQTANVYNCTFINNSTTGKGGAIYSSLNILIDGCTFKNNSASEGGALFIGKQTATIINTTITDNTTTNDTHNSTGGGVKVIEVIETCFTKGTLITMADGSNKYIEDVKENDLIRTFDHETGKLSSEKVALAYKGESLGQSMTLVFESTSINVVGTHDFFEQSTRKYVKINSENVNSYIGHYFYNANTGTYEKLLSYSINEYEEFYCLYSAHHLNVIANNMLTVADDVDYLLNIFEFDSNLKIDQNQKQKDIEKYGLLSFEASGIIDYEWYDNFNGKYAYIAIGKGFVTKQDLIKTCDDNNEYSGNNTAFKTLNKQSKKSPLLTQQTKITYQTYNHEIAKASIILGDNVTIINNKSEGVINNVYLNNAYNSGTNYGRDEIAKIAIISGAKNINVGISMNHAGTFFDQVALKDTQATSIFDADKNAYKRFFTSDDEDYGVLINTIEGTPNTYSYSLKSNCLVYDPNNKNATGDTPDTVSYDTDAEATISDQNTLALTGYKFVGWNTKADGTGTTYKKDDKITMTTTVTLYAMWEIINYDITYSLDNGSISGTYPTTYNVETDTFTLPTPTKTGQKFDGWYTEATFANKIASITKGSTGNISLYAKWSLANYDINYSLDNGTISGTYPTTYTYESDTITLPTPTKKGYKFDGWYTESTFANQITSITKGSSGDVDVYAKWIEKQTISITQTAQEYLYGTSEAKFEIKGTTLTDLTVKYTRSTNTYTTAPSASGEYNVVITRAEDETYKEVDLTITNGFKIYCTVTYLKGNATSGEAPVDSTKYYDDEYSHVIKNSGTLVRDGYKFVGWKDTNATDNIIYFANAERDFSNGNYTYAPIFELALNTISKTNNYTVEYEATDLIGDVSYQWVKLGSKSLDNMDSNVYSIDPTSTTNLGGNSLGSLYCDGFLSQAVIILIKKNLVSEDIALTFKSTETSLYYVSSTFETLAISKDAQNVFTLDVKNTYDDGEYYNVYIINSNDIPGFNRSFNLTEVAFNNVFIEISGETKSSISDATDNSTYYCVVTYTMLENGNNVTKEISTNSVKTSKVRFDSNVINSGSYVDYYQLDGREIAVPTCTYNNIGYEFIGWNSDSTATTVLSFTNNKYKVGESTTFYAIWNSLAFEEDVEISVSDLKYGVTSSNLEVTITSSNKDKLSYFKSGIYYYEIVGEEEVITKANSVDKPGQYAVMILLTFVDDKYYFNNVAQGQVETYGGVVSGSTYIVDYAGASSYDFDIPEFAHTVESFGNKYLGIALLVTLDPYTITYDDNVSDEEISVPSDTNEYITNQPATISTSACTRNGYKFLGWSLNKDATTADTFTDGKYTIGDSDVTLYAIWEEKKTISIDQDTQYFNVESKLSDIAFAITGTNIPTSGLVISYRLNNTNNEFSENLFATSPSSAYYDVKITYLEDDVYKALDITITKGIAIYISVIYHNTDATSGTVPTDSTKYVYSEITGIKKTTALSNSGNLARTGYVFNGWYSCSTSVTTLNGIDTIGEIGSILFKDQKHNVQVYPNWALDLKEISKTNDYEVKSDASLTGCSYQWTVETSYKMQDLVYGEENDYSSTTGNLTTCYQEIELLFDLKYYSEGCCFKFKSDYPFATYDYIDGEYYYYYFSPSSINNVGNYFSILLSNYDYYDGEITISDFEILCSQKIIGETNAKINNIIAGQLAYCVVSYSQTVQNIKIDKTVSTNKVKVNKIDFNGNDSSSGTAPSTMYQLEGRNIIIPENPFEKNGSKYLGWNIDKDATDVLLFTDGKYIIGDSDITFYAIWESLEYKENIAFTITTLEYGVKASDITVTVSDTNIKVTGFKLWYYDKVAKTNVAVDTVTKPGLYTMYIVVEGKTETYYFANEVNGIDRNYVGSISVSGNDLYINPFEFKFPYSIGLKTCDVTSDAAFFGDESINGYENITLGSRLYFNLSGNSVYYSENAGEETVTNMPVDTDTYLEDGSIVILTNTPIRAGYKFLGWNTNKDATCGLVFTDGKYTMGDSDILLYAIWEEKAIISIDETAQEFTYNALSQEFVLKGTNKDLEGFVIKYTIYSGEAHDDNDWLANGPIDVDYYDIKITRLEDDTYKAYEKVITQGLVINQYVIYDNAVTLCEDDFTYDGTDQQQNLTATYIDALGNVVSLKILELTPRINPKSEATFMDCAIYDVGFTFVSELESINYIFDSFGSDYFYGEYEMKPKEVVIDWSIDNYTYNGQAQVVSASYKDVNNQIVALEVNMDNEFLNAGNYLATASFANYETNYVLPTVYTKSYTMNKIAVAEPTIVGEYKYNGEAQTVVVSGVESYMSTNDSLTKTKVGVYTIQYNLDNNYCWNTTSDGLLTWEIKALQLTPKSEDSTKDSDVIVEIEEGFTDDISVVVEVKVEAEISTKEFNENIIAKEIKLEGFEKVGVIFDVKLIQTINNVTREIQPSDIAEGTTIKVKMLIPSDVDVSKITRILHIHSDTDIEAFDFDVTKLDANRYYEIETSKLSEFAFVYDQCSINHTHLIYSLIGVAILFIFMWVVLKVRAFAKENKVNFIVVFIFIIFLATFIIYLFYSRCLECYLLDSAYGLLLLGLFILYLTYKDKTNTTTVQLRDSFKEAQNTVTNCTLNKEVVASYLKETFKDDVIINRRNNYIKSGYLPLADTHYKKKENKNVCFIYVYELKDNKTFFLVKVKKELAKKINKKHPSFVRSAFPKAVNNDWYTMIIDSSYQNNNEVLEILKDIYNNN